MRKFHIQSPSTEMLPSILQKIDHLNKPKGSLGRLEELAARICLIQQTLTPSLIHPCHLLMGGDHGIEREGVSVSPREVTWQQMINFTHGGGGVNMLCRQHGFQLLLIDMGVDHDLSPYPDIINRKVAFGTQDFRYHPAMSEQQMDRAVNAGVEMSDRCQAEGCNVICIGEMGIGNTSPSSIWMSLLGNIPLDDCIGAGSGLDTPGLQHKRAVLAESVTRYHAEGGTDTPESLIRYFGGFEMAGAIGAMLRSAEHKMVILVDGFIMTACMLAASRLYPEVLDYAVFGHCGDESGHLRMLELMDARPLLHLGLRLGEGTGALCAYPLLETSVRMINEMNNFDNAHITKYF